MSIIDILIILACVAGGYWIVSSVMGPGVDITHRDTQQPSNDARTAAKSLPNPPRADWNLLLDVPKTADRAEIEAAYKRQLNKALASGDTQQQEQLRLARDAALAHTRRDALGD
jgi:hypothetical protein